MYGPRVRIVPGAEELRRPSEMHQGSVCMGCGSVWPRAFVVDVTFMHALRERAWQAGGGCLISVCQWM